MHLVMFAQPWETLLEDSVGFVYGTSSDLEMLVLSDQLATRAKPNQVHLFDGSDWSEIADSTIGQGANPIRGACRYKGIPYCYHYSSTNGYGVFRFNGSAWLLIGEMPNGGVQGMKVYDDTLYVFGSFREINGDTNLRQIVKYDGETFLPAAAPLYYFSTSVPVVKDICFYQGELYAVGDIKTSTGKYNISRWNGLQWNDVGDGFQYSSYPSKLLEYNGYLLINSEYPVTYSGAVNGVTAWDGQQFYGLGDCACEGDAGATYMAVHEEKLFISGACNYPVQGWENYLASFDGERWCRYLGNEQVKHMISFQGNMYAYLLDHPNGPVHRFVRWLDETEPDWCGETIHLGVGDVEADAGEITIYPNPTTSTTTLTWQNQTHGNYQLHVYDVHGQQVLHHSGMATNGSNTLSIDMGAFAKGIYFGRLLVGEEVRGFKVVRE